MAHCLGRLDPAPGHGQAELVDIVAKRAGTTRSARHCLKLGVAHLVLALAAISCSPDTTETRDGQPTASTTAGSESTTSSVSTPTETAATPAPSTETVAPSRPLRLLVDGLGVLEFGEPADTALPLLVQAVGSQPTGDSTITGVMPQGFGGTAVRFVEFGQLTVIFSDGAYYRDDGVMHFAGWTLAGTDPSELATPEGITLGSIVDDLQTAFGDQLQLPSTLNDCTGSWFFSVGPSVLGFEGDLSGPSTDGSSSVIRLSAGAGSEC